jgi:glycosyltransferase involved in cell wall biosynthesis
MKMLPLRDRTWCAIPVFNNRDTVRDVALACRRNLSHVVVVDDGSTDADIGALLGGTDIVVLKHPRNAGKGQAILTALRYVREHEGEFMITVDADGQHDPDDIPKLLDVMAGHPTAIVIGARRMDGPNVPASSRFGMRFSDFWLRVETGVAMRDTQSGFRAYPVAPISALRLAGRHYEFEVEVLAKAAWAGLEIRSVDVGVTYAERGRRVSHFKPFLDNLRISHGHAKLVGRRLLPWPHHQLVKRAGDHPWLLLRHPIRFFRGLLLEHATPAELGMAAAVGTFIATLPLISLHTVAILYVATRLHLNRVMAVAIQNLCMPPVVPFLCVELGYRMRHGCWLSAMTRETWVHQAPQRVWEWFLGSLVAAPLIAVVTGFLVFGLAAWLGVKGAGAGRNRAGQEGPTT